MEFKIGDYVRRRDWANIEGIIIPVPPGPWEASSRRYRLYCIYDETYHKPGDKLYITEPTKWELVER